MVLIGAQCLAVSRRQIKRASDGKISSGCLSVLLLSAADKVQRGFERFILQMPYGASGSLCLVLLQSFNRKGSLGLVIVNLTKSSAICCSSMLTYSRSYGTFVTILVTAVFGCDAQTLI